MTLDARLFNCARCHCQVTICRHCDRGQIYCPGDCAQISRQESSRRASRRYQSSHRGRMANARRQRQYRQRQREKVTHQGSALDKPDDLLAATPDKPQNNDVSADVSPGTDIYCHFCQQQCDPFLRNHFLRPTNRSQRPW